MDFYEVLKNIKIDDIDKKKLKELIYETFPEATSTHKISEKMLTNRTTISNKDWFFLLDGELNRVLEVHVSPVELLEVPLIFYLLRFGSEKIINVGVISAILSPFISFPSYLKKLISIIKNNENLQSEEIKLFLLLNY
jgi:hypothetical protein